MSRATYPTDMYSGWEKRPKRKPYNTKKRRQQEILDEAEQVKESDKRIWIVLIVVFVVVVIVSFLWMKPL